MHTGVPCRVTVHPAAPGTGRIIHTQNVAIPARADHVVATLRSTTLGRDGVSVGTVEHLLSALHGFGVDNVLIEVTGPEIPILDGSALPFAQAIQEAGLTEQGCPAHTQLLRAPFSLTEGDSEAVVVPASALRLEVVTEFAEWPEGQAAACFAVGPESMADYTATVAPARTFAFQREAQMLLAAGLAQGGSLDNALVITPPNTFSTPLRLPTEWCAHKLLDLIGDLALVDARLQMQVHLRRPGHRINTLLARRLLEQSEEARSDRAGRERGQE
jgi:UDP-3-O-[3-hydroxymyristoyl] N-acetylglucosamine deacetylase